MQRKRDGVFEEYYSRKPRSQRALPVGVYKTHSGKYAARLKADGKLWYFGTFFTVAEAAAAYETAQRRRAEGTFLQHYHPGKSIGAITRKRKRSVARFRASAY